jgi:hypothetical protein
MTQKKPWQSKTILVNFLVAVLAFFPDLQDKASPESIMQVLVVVNIILRLITKDKIGLS